MTTTTRMMEIERAPIFDEFAPRNSLGADLVHSIMKPLRRAAITFLDMRTEFEVIEIGEELPICTQQPVGSMANFRLAAARRIRRAATWILDPWTEIVILD